MEPGEELCDVSHTVGEVNDWTTAEVIQQLLYPCNLSLHVVLRLLKNNDAGMIQAEMSAADFYRQNRLIR